MRVAIVGAGAIGGVIAGYLLNKGEHDVSLLVRGAHLDAIRARGLRLSTRGKLFESRPEASDDPAQLGAQDVIICTLKAYSLGAVAPRLAPMIGPNTVVVAAQNGIPWWYFFGGGGELANQPYDVVDPGGAIWKSLGAERAIGCVITIPASMPEPGSVLHNGQLRLTIGAPRDGDHARAIGEIVSALAATGIEAEHTSAIRKSIWEKILLNIGVNPFSMLTGAASGELRNEPGLNEPRIRAMREARSVARALDIDVADTSEWIIANVTGHHKASMLQDFEAGKPVELDAIMTAVIDLGRRRNVPVPTIEMLWALIKVKLAALQR